MSGLGQKILDALPGIRVAGRQIADLFRRKERGWTCPGCYSYNRVPTGKEAKGPRMVTWGERTYPSPYPGWWQCQSCGRVPPPGLGAPPTP